MSIRVFDFRCAQGHVVEQFVDADCWSVECPTCREPAMRMIAAPRAKLDPLSGHFPGATMAWEQRRESHMKWERKQMAANGEIPGNPLPQWRESVGAK
jgi:hypothetical protein